METIVRPPYHLQMTNWRRILYLVSAVHVLIPSLPVSRSGDSRRADSDEYRMSTLAPVSRISGSLMGPGSAQKNLSLIQEAADLRKPLSEPWAVTREGRALLIDLVCLSWVHVYSALTLIHELRLHGNRNPFAVHLDLHTMTASQRKHIQDTLHAYGEIFFDSLKEGRISFDFTQALGLVRGHTERTGILSISIPLEMVKAWHGPINQDETARFREQFRMNSGEREMVIGSADVRDMNMLVRPFAQWIAGEGLPIRLIVVPRVSAGRAWKSELDSVTSTVLWQRDAEERWIPEGDPDAKVLVIDSQGDLRNLYGLADLARLRENTRRTLQAVRSSMTLPAIYDLIALLKRITFPSDSAERILETQV